MANSNQAQRGENRTHLLILVLFCAALGFHIWGVSVGWMSLNLPGCEFRQTQTAISAFHIQKDHDFSLAYPTPVLGKPWSIPMEFPLYQWTVVGLSNGTGWSLTSSGRAVSVICFYLTLPALYLLLGRLGLAWSRRLLVLGLLLTCPLYIFYTRSFLIETMALMFGGWFVFAYVKGIEERKAAWILVAIVAGTGCGLVKVTSYLFFLMPAFLWTIIWFIQDWRGGREKRTHALFRRFAWCTAAVAIPFAASIWWVQYSDAIKAITVTGRFLRSGPMAPYHFGEGVRFSADIWRQHWHILFYYITSLPVLAGCAALALIYARKRVWLLLTLVGMFFIVQLIFPVLYAWHEYYYVTNACALIFAVGLVLDSLFDARCPRVLAWVAVFGIYGLQAHSYLENYYEDQKQMSPGGTDLTLALKRVTAPNEVIIIAGNDWSSITPYYSQRRALMIRAQEEKNWGLIHPAFQALKGESVTALILHGEQVNNKTLRELATAYFDIDPRPAFQWYDAQVYLHKSIRASAGPLVKDIPNIRLLELKEDEPDPQLRHEIFTTEAMPRYRNVLDAIIPKPFKYYTNYGLTFIDQDGHRFLNGHPDTRFWFKLEKGRHQFSVEVELASGAYDDRIPRGDRTDGILMTLEEELPDGGTQRILFSRRLNPRDNSGDRGLLHLTGDFELNQSGVVSFNIGPGPDDNFNRDWTLFRALQIR